MARRGAVRVSITGDTSGLNRATRDAERQLGGMGRAGKRSMGLLRAGAVPAAAALGGLAIGLKSAVDEYVEAEKAGKQTNAVLKSTKGVANVTAKEVEKLANAISLKSGMDDEAIQSAENLLLTFTKVRNETGKGNDIFNRATQVVTDMSVALGQDMKSSSIQVGKALNDPIKGITALRRVGVAFTQQQQDQIVAMTESGNRLGAQKLILRELTTEFGGSAAAQATSFDRLKVAGQNMLETIGRAIGPSLSRAANAIANFINQMNSGTGAGGRFAETIRNVFGSVRRTVGVAVNAVRGFLTRNREDIRRTGEAFRNVFNAVRAVAARVFPGVKQIVQGQLRIIGGIVKVFAGLLTGDFRGMWRGIRQIFSGALKTLGGVVRAATAPMREAGAALVRGLIRGLKSLPGAIINAGKDLGRSILNAVKDFLGIKSPSRAFMDVGRNIVAGLARGLDAGDAVSVVKKHFGGLASLAVKLVTAGTLKAASIPKAGLEKLGKFGSQQIQELFGGETGFDKSIRGLKLVGIGKRLQAMGFQVGEHPAFGGVGGSHVRGSYHYQGRAIDVNWPNAAMEPGKLDAIYRMLRGVPHKELLWRTEGHHDHLHFAMQRGGMIPGRGDGDRIPVMAEPGEGFINKRAVAAMGGRRALDALNQMIPRFAKGGVVGKMVGYARNAGFKGRAAAVAAAVAMAESGGRARAHGDRSLGGSYGLWQIHHPSHPQYPISKLLNPAYNARVAYAISGGGKNWRPWTTFRTGAYRRYLSGALAALGGSKTPRKFGGPPTGPLIVSTGKPGPLTSPKGQSFTPEKVERGGGVAADVEAPAADPNIERLANAQEEGNRLRAEAIAQGKRVEVLMQTQGPALVGYVIDAVSGGLGGTIGLGFQSPGVAGRGYRY